MGQWAVLEVLEELGRVAVEGGRSCLLRSGAVVRPVRTATHGSPQRAAASTSHTAGDGMGTEDGRPN